MKPKEPVESGQHDIFRSRLDQIIDMSHEKVVLAITIDWQSLSDKCGENYTGRAGHAATSARRPALHISLSVRGDMPEEGNGSRFDAALCQYASHAVAPQ